VVEKKTRFLSMTHRQHKLAHTSTPSIPTLCNDEMVSGVRRSAALGRLAMTSRGYVRRDRQHRAGGMSEVVPVTGDKTKPKDLAWGTAGAASLACSPGLLVHFPAWGLSQAPSERRTHGLRSPVDRIVDLDRARSPAEAHQRAAKEPRSLDCRV
jgi:hypothetical protein